MQRMWQTQQPTKRVDSSLWQKPPATAVAGEKIANSRALAVIASGKLEQNPEFTLAIALEANRDTTTFEANDVLRRALRASRLRGVLRGTADRLETVALSPDGNRALTADSARKVHVWDTGTGNPLFRVDGFDDAQFSKDGNLFLTRFDGRVRLWDANTFEEKVVLELWHFED